LLPDAIPKRWEESRYKLPGHGGPEGGPGPECVAYVVVFLGKGKGKGKAVPLQASSGPEVSRKLRFPNFMTTAQDCGKVVSLTHRLSLPPGNTPGTHFC
jgi:hypothetical protein